MKRDVYLQNPPQAMAQGILPIWWIQMLLWNFHWNEIILQKEKYSEFGNLKKLFRKKCLSFVVYGFIGELNKV
jgi:hypothetical protein